MVQQNCHGMTISTHPSLVISSFLNNELWGWAATICINRLPSLWQIHSWYYSYRDVVHTARIVYMCYICYCFLCVAHLLAYTPHIRQHIHDTKRNDICSTYKWPRYLLILLLVRNLTTKFFAFPQTWIWPLCHVLLVSVQSDDGNSGYTHTIWGG